MSSVSNSNTKRLWAMLFNLSISSVVLEILGLIIDAFGELRDQQEQVKEDMEVKRQTQTHTQILTIHHE